MLQVQLTLSFEYHLQFIHILFYLKDISSNHVGICSCLRVEYCLYCCVGGEDVFVALSDEGVGSAYK